MSATPRQLTQYITLFGATVAILNTVDGPWKRWDKGTILDNWTWTHLLWGWLGARMGQSMPQQMTLAALNEIAENLIRRYRPDLTWGTPESQYNIMTDLLSNAAGWWIGAQR